jgi:hypothetical protein
MKNLEDCKTCGNNYKQVEQAFLDPLNRLGTMQEHKCDDYGLYLHPNWLVIHYIKFGGADAFALERERMLALAEMTPEYCI